MAAPRAVLVNRAPVLTLWAAIVAERLGHDRKTALTLGKALAGLNAQSKGRRLGLYRAPPEDVVKKRASARARSGASTVELMGRKLTVVKTREGLRAAKDGTPEEPDAIERALERKLGDALPDVRAAMTALAKSLPKEALAERAYGLYEAFRPSVPAGERGWGKKGELDLDTLRALAQHKPTTGATARKPRSR